MAKSLVVVESPAKAKTINKYLGRDYKVIASMGHVRDLPKSKLGVDIENDFAEQYESLASRKKVLKELKDAAKDASDIYITTDPDREGDAIGWHIAQELAGKKRKFHRLTFNEITKKAVQEALNNPRIIDEKMVAAQRARRVLDRLVGYKISPLLWDKVRRGLSAGRVQSVALKLICDREREIEQFVPVEYWHLFARLAGPQPPEFEAKLHKKNGENIVPANETESNAVLKGLEQATWVVSGVTTKERKRNAAPPFITSKLQQTARFPVKKTMMIAQQLYEGGIANTALTADQYSLYRMIWNRFVASQMPPATFDETMVDITAKEYVFRVKGTVPKFPGWLATYGPAIEDVEPKEKPKASSAGDDEDDEGV